MFKWSQKRCVRHWWCYSHCWGPWVWQSCTWCTPVEAGISVLLLHFWCTEDRWRLVAKDSYKPFLRGQQVSLGGLFCLLFLLLQQLGGVLLGRLWDRGCVNVGLPLPVRLQAGSLWWPCENTSSISLMISRHWSELGNICNHPVWNLFSPGNSLMS